MIFLLVLLVVFFFFFKQKTAYEIMPSLVGSEMCIRDRSREDPMSLQRPFRFTRSWGVAAVAAGALVGSLMAVPATATAATVPGAPAVVADPAALVNPIIGTSGAVDTFPGPDMPFGMMQWSPDTSPNRPNGGGYEYNNSQIRGFSLTHISGPGCAAYGDIPILPLVGACLLYTSDAA